jgi:hypothetical protein
MGFKGPEVRILSSRPVLTRLLEKSKSLFFAHFLALFSGILFFGHQAFCLITSQGNGTGSIARTSQLDQVRILTDRHGRRPAQEQRRQHTQYARYWYDVREFRFQNSLGKVVKKMTILMKCEAF